MEAESICPFKIKVDGVTVLIRSVVEEADGGVGIKYAINKLEEQPDTEKKVQAYLTQVVRKYVKENIGGELDVIQKQ